MKNIIDFETYNDFKLFLNKKKLEFIGSGSEGDCYYSRADDLVYKVLAGYAHDYFLYDVNKIILANEVDPVSTYIFPESLLTCAGELLGNTLHFIPNDCFDLKHTIDVRYLKKINFNQLRKAYEIAKRDTEKLSTQSILICDLLYNLLYNHKQLYGIDTYYYRRKKESVQKNNLESLEGAFKGVFELWTRSDDRFQIDPSLDVEEYIKELSKQTKLILK